MAIVTNFNPPASWTDWKKVLRYQPRIYYPATLIEQQAKWEYWMAGSMYQKEEYGYDTRSKHDPKRAWWDDQYWWI